MVLYCASTPPSFGFAHDDLHVAGGSGCFLLTHNGRLNLPASWAIQSSGCTRAIQDIDPVTGLDLPSDCPANWSHAAHRDDGLLQEDEETRAAFNADGWLHTGDVGVITSDGYLTLTGRPEGNPTAGGGEMVMPREIEEIAE